MCAAPGGWTQVASRTMATSRGSGGNNIIVAVDILPMRAIPNVITLIGDITTEKCKAQIKAKLQTALADVVLCDGAPNVGASYDRDAYQQNEIALHALKCATQHLRRHGTFVTKIYRSSDYSSYLWIVKQLFENVQAVKPNASRSQSAEIFLVCTGYLDPTSIDPRMLDPKCVFEQVDGAATGGGDSAQTNGTKGISIFHKKFDEKRRSRQGYDMDTMDSTMRNVGFVSDFIESSGSGARVSKSDKKDPIEILSNCTGLSFTCHLCKERDVREKNDIQNHDIPDCNCQFYLNHKLTTTEIKTCVSDLKVLNKGDFKGLLTWRTKIQEALKELQADSDKDDDNDASVSSVEEELDSDAEEEKIQSEIAQLRHRKLREQKRLKKKEREAAAKRRKRAALGMDLNAVEVPEAEKMFSLATITSKGTLEAAREVDLNKVTDDQIFPTVDSDNEDGGDDLNVERNEHGEVIAQGEEDDVDEETGYSYRLDRELDMAYDRYLSKTKNKSAKVGTKMAKRSKKAMRLKAAEQAQEDDELMGEDTKAYAEMLQGKKDSDDDDSSEDEAGVSSSDDDDDGFRSTPMTPQEHQRNIQRKKNNEEHNPLIHTLPDEPASVKSARWFSNPIFETIGTTASLATISNPKSNSKLNRTIESYDSDNDSDAVEYLDSEDENPVRKKQRKKGNGKRTQKDDSDSSDNELTADKVLAMMPKTDKQIRHEKRLKSIERMERRKTRRARLAGETDEDFEVVGGNANDDMKDKIDLENLSEKERKKVLEARALIKAGLGEQMTGDDASGFEVVSAVDSKKAGSLLPVMDTRKYDSENEDYDSDDYAKTLALGTMMLRKSKEKALVDASYNRYAWNDPSDLPDWFVDDENKNYRPQLPIPPALLAKMKEKFVSLATRPIAKVAEARARKNKRAKLKLAAAKKKAEAVANSSEMSEAMKLKAISKAMRGHDATKPGKTYVVSRKGGGTKGGKGVKLVDKRMKNDKRSMDRSTKKQKNGKQGGLTGSKRRRHHK